MALKPLLLRGSAQCNSSAAIFNILLKVDEQIKCPSLTGTTFMIFFLGGGEDDFDNDY